MEIYSNFKLNFKNLFFQIKLYKYIEIYFQNNDQNDLKK